jgi:iron complex transport system substrate-binding protein
MATPALRIISLIPSATEMIHSLGYGSFLVGRSHACDFPETVKNLPVCTTPRFQPQGSSREIHQRVTEIVQSALSVYEIDTDLVAELRPTHIITQAQCEVCAVSLADVIKAVASIIPTAPQIISLQPSVLAEVWEDLERVATALDPLEGRVRATTTISQLQRRLQTCIQSIPPRLPQQTVACLKWSDPLMAAGNWVPELVAMAGGHPLFGQVGQQSSWLQWEDLVAADPDSIIVMCCGYDLNQTRNAIQLFEQQPAWFRLQAVQNFRIYLTDGNHYFNRPGPRLVDSLEILAEILHPDDCQYGYAMKAWKLY